MNVIELRELAARAEDLGERQGQLNALVGQLQQLVHQVLTSSREQAERLHALEEELSLIAPQVNRLLHIDGELRQAQDRLAQLGEVQTELRGQLEQSERLRQAEAERERQARAELWQKQEFFEHGQTYSQSRLASLEELTRRLREQLLEFPDQLGDLKQRDAALDGRLSGYQEYIKRQEQEMARLSQELEALHKQDETTSGRLQILAELIRQVDERSSGKDIEERLHRELEERIERVRVEIQRMDGLVFDFRRDWEEQGQEMAKLAHRLGQMEGRVRSLDDRFDELTNKLQAYRQQMMDHVVSLAEAEEQQKRHQIGDLERQVQELKRRSLNWARS